MGRFWLTVGLIFAVLSPAAARKPKRLNASAAPAWLREAARLEIEGDLAAAETLLLHDELVVEPLATGGVRLARRQALRVLKPEGLVDAGALGFTYSEGDDVEVAMGWNLLPDGSMRRPDPDDDVTDRAWTQAGNAVDDTRLRDVQLPGCRVGSVIGWEWTVVRKIDTGAAIESYGHTRKPVGRCRIELRVPPGWSWEDLGERSDSFVRTAGERGVTWSSPGFQPPPREEFPPPAAERLPRIAVRWFSPDGSRGFRDWAAVGAWYRTLSERTLADAGESAQLALDFKPAGQEQLEEALRAAFLFCSREVRYVSVQLGIGGFRPATPGRTCKNRYGDCKAKSFLMRSLVERWGLKSFPVLVRTSTAGEVLEGVPSPGQFNHCIVAVQLPDGVRAEAWNTLEIAGLGRLAFLDATTTALGPWQLREDDQGTLALLVTPDGGRLIELPVQPPAESSSHWDLRLNVAPDGTVASGELTWTALGTKAGSLRYRLAGQSQAQLNRFHETFAQELAPGAQLGTRSLTGLDAPDGPIELRLAFTGGRVGQAAGPILIVSSTVTATPVGSADLPPGERSETLWLGLPRERRVDVEIVAPQGWVPEALPGPFSVENRWLSLEGAWERTDAGYRFTSVGRLKAREVAAADYLAFRSALQSAAAAAEEGVVLVQASP